MFPKIKYSPQILGTSSTTAFVVLIAVVFFSFSKIDARTHEFGKLNFGPWGRPKSINKA